MKPFPAALMTVLASVPCAPPAWADQQPESVTPVQAVAPVQADIAIRVPVGLDTKAPPGADLTGGFADTFPSGGGAEAPAAGEGEWVFVPIPFKNALLGAGVQAGAGRLYKPAGRPEQQQASMFGVGGMYAEGGSWAAVVGDRRYWGKQADVRSTAVAGLGEVSYPIVVVGPQVTLSVPMEQSFEGGLLKLGYEVRDHLWLSAGFKFATTEIVIKGLDIEIPGSFALQPKLDIDLATLTVSADWDSRSDQFYPRDGSLISAEIGHADTVYGSDSNYTVYDLSYNGYLPLGEQHTLAWRLAGKTVAGDPPFFALAWFGSGVDLRGYTPGTYIGKGMAAAQAEWRWQATRRLGLVAFGGIGGVWGDIPTFEQDNLLPAGGLGLRWRLTEKFRVNFRIDYAWGKDDEVLLISVGEAF